MTSLVRHQSTTWGIDHEAEAEYAKQMVGARPDLVSTGSSVHHVTYEIGVEEGEKDIDMMAGIRSDFVCLAPSMSIICVCA